MRGGSKDTGNIKGQTTEGLIALSQTSAARLIPHPADKAALAGLPGMRMLKASLDIRALEPYP